jgi:hypothetical protein
MTVSRIGWATAAAVKTAVERKWDRGALLRDLHAPAGEWQEFPLRVRLHGPGRDELAIRFAEASVWARDLAAAAARDGWRLDTRPMRVGGLGTQQLPIAAIVPSPQAALRLLGRNHTAAAGRFADALACADALDPAARALALGRPHDVLAAAEDWPLLLALAAWIRDHPRPRIYPRQIPVAGVHTKVLERHNTLLGRLLEKLMPAEALGSPGASFAARFGFLEDARRARIRGDAAVLGTPGAGIVDVEWPVATLAALNPHNHSIRELLVLENKTSYVIVPAVPGRLLLWGAGYGVDEMLASLPWRRDVAVRYWGDIDTHGFAMLARVRTVAPHTTSVLMDLETLLEHRPYWSTEPVPRRDPLPTLTPAEQSLYAALCDDVHGRSVRLEQEFIRFDLVQVALTDDAVQQSP